MKYIQVPVGEHQILPSASFPRNRLRGNADSGKSPGFVSRCRGQGKHVDATLRKTPGQSQEYRRERNGTDHLRQIRHYLPEIKGIYEKQVQPVGHPPSGHQEHIRGGL